MFFIFKFFIMILPVLIGIAFLTLIERKVLGFVGLRLGPNKVSMLGIFQPIGDAVKLSNKQFNLLSNFSFLFYYLSSFFMLFSMFILWSCLSSFPSSISFKYSILIFMVVLGFNSLNSMISGWSTFGKFSLIGSMRTVAQLISYESVLYFCLLFFVMYFYTYDFSKFFFFSLDYLFFFIPFCFYMWVPSSLAELNRTPYDFSEGESELVSGFNTEFGSSSFTFIFLAEYGNILFFCYLSSFLFFCSYSIIFFFFYLFFVLWIRSVLPRFRFDKLMMLAWKFFIPFITLMFLNSIVFLF